MLTKSLKILLAVAGTILTAGIFFYVFYLFYPPKMNTELKRFVVPLKTSEKKTINRLYSQGYIRNRTIFKFILFVKGEKGRIKPGGYKVSKSMSPFKIADILTNHPYQKWAVIPEGLRKEEIAEILKKQLGWTKEDKNDFLNSAKEGYLFPDTYLFNLNYSGKEVANRMIDKFNKKVSGLFIEAQKNNIRTDTLIILASLLQREAANEKEMPLIAGIIWNRWLADMNFEIDASLQYALGKPDKWWPVVKKEDYKLKSPYNTYIHKGKPPTPICSPGLAAIKAVVRPQDSDYFYYLHDQNRQIHLAKTYEQHLENIKNYIMLPAAKTFTENYLSAYRNIEEKKNYEEVKSFLTEKELSHMEEKSMSLKKNYTPFDNYEILDATEAKDNPEADYIVKVKLYYKGQILKNPKTGEIIEIYIIKEKGSFKTST